jgi:hypothetical protein
MPSTTPKTLGAYADCIGLMRRALDRGGCLAKFASRGAAINFRQRCYRARSILLDAAKDSALPGEVPSTIYDSLYIQLRPEEPTEGPAELYFRIRHFTGEVEDLHETVEADPLMEEAAALKRRLTFE